MTVEFVPFQKIGRLRRSMVVTEKIDGTNAQVLITDDGDVFAGSRNRWLTLEADNFGFARWVEGNRQELLGLGAGRHFGEWWGQGIQRGYGLKEKRFSLFNTHRWNSHHPAPACCHVVPVLNDCGFDTAAIAATMSALAEAGSSAAPGFMKPEGIVIYHRQTGSLFKQTFEHDDEGKGREPVLAAA